MERLSTGQVVIMPAGQLESEMLERISAFGERRDHVNPVHATVASQTTRFQKTHCALVLIRKKTKAITGELANFIGNWRKLFAITPFP